MQSEHPGLFVPTHAFEHAGRQKASPSQLKIQPAKNGGFVVEHSFDNADRGESYRPSETHAFSSHKEMIAHVIKHAGGWRNNEAPGARATGVGHVGKPPSAAMLRRGRGVD